MEGVESFIRDTEYQMVVATCENNPDLEKEEIRRMLQSPTRRNNNLSVIAGL